MKTYIVSVDALYKNETDKIKDGIEKYRFLKNHFHSFDVDFKCVFVVFYGCYLNRSFMKKLNDCFNSFKELIPNNSISFNDALQLFSVLRKRINDICLCDETTFVTKMIHTLYDGFPIIDSKARKFFGISRGQLKANAEEHIRSIHHFYEEYISSSEGKQNIKRFKETFGCPDISDVKIIDFLIWVGE